MIYEQHIALNLVAKLAGRFGPGSRVAKALPGWLEYLSEVECPERPNDGTDSVWWSNVRDLACHLVGGATVGEGETVLKNAALLGEHFELTSLEERIFCFVALYKLFNGFEHVVDQAIDTKEVTFSFLLSQFCEADEGSIRAALRSDGRLRMLGLLQWERGWHRPVVPYEIGDRLCEAMLAEVGDLERLISVLFPAAVAPDAEWKDFEGMARDAEFMRDLLVRALADGTPGVNLLLYGPPGTGKTEFAKVLAREVGAQLRAVGEMDERGQEPSRLERLSELGIAGRMLCSRRDTVLLLDEMEDLFGDCMAFSRSDRPSKVFSNRLLETNPVPTIWTTNSVTSCDPAFLRRMTFSVLMRPPSGRVRARIWQRLDARHSPGVDADDLPRLAEAHDHPPALVSDAMRVARLTGGGSEVLEQVLGAAARLANGGIDPTPKHPGEVSWQPNLARADADLVRIETRMSLPEASRRVSFCLEGPAGTGKSAWARHLARSMGLPVHEKRASDLMSPYVGENEKNIATAFAEARADGAMLIFDEADSLLADRRSAVRNWEVSQVNEMLTWMEIHPLPFVCTTNLAERLDPATQRRFTFRIKFDWLSPAQLPWAWSAHFGDETDMPPALLALDRLTPGDFANVARRMRALGVEDPTAILAELSDEADAKNAARRPIGFVC